MWSDQSLGFTTILIRNFRNNRQASILFFSPTSPPADDFGERILVMWRKVVASHQRKAESKNPEQNPLAEYFVWEIHSGLKVKNAE